MRRLVWLLLLGRQQPRRPVVSVSFAELLEYDARVRRGGWVS